VHRRKIVNHEVERNGKDAVQPHIKVLSQHLTWGGGEANEDQNK